MYVSDPWNANFDDLTFDCDQRLIARWKKYAVNDYIVEILNNGSIVDVYMYWM